MAMAYESSNLVGVWLLESSENYEQFLEKLGVNSERCNILVDLKPTAIISNENDRWIIKLDSKYRTFEIDCREDEEFDLRTIDDKICKTIIRSDGPNRLVQENRDPLNGEIISIVYREADSYDQMTQTMIANGVRCVRTFKRVLK